MCPNLFKIMTNCLFIKFESLRLKTKSELFFLFKIYFDKVTLSKSFKLNDTLLKYHLI